MPNLASQRLVSLYYRRKKPSWWKKIRIFFQQKNMVVQLSMWKNWSHYTLRLGGENLWGKKFWKCNDLRRKTRETGAFSRKFRNPNFSKSTTFRANERFVGDISSLKFPGKLYLKFGAAIKNWMSAIMPHGWIHGHCTDWVSPKKNLAKNGSLGNLFIFHSFFRNFRVELKINNKNEIELFCDLISSFATPTNMWRQQLAMRKEMINFIQKRGGGVLQN